MISVALVEDHEQYRISLANMIHENNMLQITGSYASAEEAMNSIVANPPNITIVDIRLKDLSGIDFIYQIKAKVLNTQFMICSAYQNSENVFKALKAGASGYIVKGASSAEIQNAVIELHNGGAPMSPYIARKVISLLHKEEQPNNYELSDRELEVSLTIK